MKRKFLWLGASCLMALSLVVVSCGTAEVEEEEKEQEIVEEEEVESADRPKYGGILTTVIVRDPGNWDTQASPAGGQAYGSGRIYEQYMTSDWTRGVAGSNVVFWPPGSSSLEDYYYPQLAESWENPDQNTWILNIRQGVHWQEVDSDAGRIMGGREMTVDDIIYSFNRSKDLKSSWVNVAQPAGAEAMTIEQTGPWQVTIKVPLEPLAIWFFMIQGGGHHNVFPREVVEEYGNLLDWRNAVGTGPFMLEDFVSASSVTLARNPNYWDTNPLGPGKGDQLPYVDKFVELVISDTSTQIAALRTGKVDILSGVARELALQLIGEQADLEYVKYLGNTPWIIGMRTDKEDLPFHDIRVRQAMMMATDFKSLKDDLYEGDAEIDVIPWNKNFGESFTPLSEQPQAVQDLYSYNPERAKELLTEAGYPDGFKIKVTSSNGAVEVDDLSLFKDMWAKVGIELEIEPLEYGAYNTIVTTRSHEELLYRFSWRIFPVLYYFAGIRGPNWDNSSYTNDPPGSDPYIESVFEDVQKNAVSNMPAVYASFKEMQTYLMEQVRVIPRPTPYTYNMWQPWVKNYHGEGGTRFLRYHWVDTELKESMGY